MSKIKRLIFKNIAGSMVLHVVSQLFYLAFIVVFARVLGQEAYGSYCYALNFANLFTYFTGFGLSYQLNREIAIARERTRNLLNACISLTAVINLAALLIVMAILTTVEQPAEVKAGIVIFFLGLCVNAVVSLYYAVFRALDRMVYQYRLLFWWRLVFAAAGIALVFIGVSLVVFSLVFLLSQIAILAAGWFMLKKQVAGYRYVFTLQGSPILLQTGLLLAISGGLLGINTRIDTVILGNFRSLAETGLYNAVYNVTLAMSFLVGIYGMGFFPEMARSFARDRDRLILVYTKMLKLLIVLMVPFFSFWLNYGDPVFTAVFGAQYLPATRILEIMVAAELFAWVSFINNQFFMIVKNMKVMIVALSLAALLNLGLNLLYIPRYGYIAAALTTLASEFSLMLVSTGMVAALFRRHFYRRETRKVIIMVLWMLPTGTAALLIREPVLNLTTVTAIWLIGIIGLRVVVWNELPYVGALLSWRGRT